ncbi:hypothetical protein GW750_04640 [bacterium]|nr:hypothetical protein [bacterium]
MQQKSFEELQKRYPDTDHNELQIKAESIAMGAIKFFFIKYDPLKDFVFDAQASISFE